MARRRQYIPPPETKLIIPKEEFKRKVDERLQLGRELLTKSQEISTIPELESQEEEYGKWNSYNSELFKVSFNNERNEYKGRYDNAGMMDGVDYVLRGGDIHDPRYRIGQLSDDIKTKISSLEDLINKIELLKTEAKDINSDSVTPIQKVISKRVSNKKLQSELESLVIQNKLNEVLERIKAEVPEIRKEVNLHLANYNDIREKGRLGLLDHRQLDLKLIRLRAAILDLIEKC